MGGSDSQGSNFPPLQLTLKAAPHFNAISLGARITLPSNHLGCLLLSWALCTRSGCRKGSSSCEYNPNSNATQNARQLLHIAQSRQYFRSDWEAVAATAVSITRLICSVSPHSITARKPTAHSTVINGNPGRVTATAKKQRRTGGYTILCPLPASKTQLAPFTHGSRGLA